MVKKLEVSVNIKKYSLDFRYILAFFKCNKNKNLVNQYVFVKKTPFYIISYQKF